LGVDAVGLAQQRLGQAVVAVQHLGQEVALDAVDAAVDLGMHVAMGGHHPPILDRDVDPAPGAAVPAGRLAPLELDLVALGDQVAAAPGQRQAGGGRGGGDGGGADEIATCRAHALAPRAVAAGRGWDTGSSSAAEGSAWWYTSSTLSTPGTALSWSIRSITRWRSADSHSTTLRLSPRSASSRSGCIATAASSAAWACSRCWTTKLAIWTSSGVFMRPPPAGCRPGPAHWPGIPRRRRRSRCSAPHRRPP